jgi:hypothetical protein
LHRFVWLYNEHLPQRALDLSTPIRALKKWQSAHPDLFSKRVVNHPGPDSYWIAAFLRRGFAKLAFLIDPSPARGAREHREESKKPD